MQYEHYKNYTNEVTLI